MFYKNQTMISESAWWTSIKNQFGIHNEEFNLNINLNKTLMDLKVGDLISHILQPKPTEIKIFEASYYKKEKNKEGQFKTSTKSQNTDNLIDALEIIKNSENTPEGTAYIAAHLEDGSILYLITFENNKIGIHDTLKKYNAKVWKPTPLLD